MPQKNSLILNSQPLTIEEVVKLLADYTLIIFSLKNSKESHSTTFDTDFNGSTPNKSVQGESSPYGTDEDRFLSCDSLGPPIPQISLFQPTSNSEMKVVSPSPKTKTPTKQLASRRVNLLSGATPLHEFKPKRRTSQSSKNIRLDAVEPITDRRTNRFSLYPEAGVPVDIYSGDNTCIEAKVLRCTTPQRTPRPSRLDGRSGSSGAVAPAQSVTSSESKRTLTEFRGIASAFNFEVPKFSVQLRPSGSTSWRSLAPRIQLKPQTETRMSAAPKQEQKANPTPQQRVPQSANNDDSNQPVNSNIKHFECSKQEVSCQNHVIPASPGLGKSGSAKVVRFVDPQPTVYLQSRSSQIPTFAKAKNSASKPSSRSGSAASDDTRPSSKPSPISNQPLAHGASATAEAKPIRKLKLTIVESARKTGASPQNSPQRAAALTSYIGSAQFVGSRPASPKVSAPGSPVSRPVHRMLLEHLSIFSRRSYADATESCSHEQH